ncbi:uncharacterized protein LOC131011251 [Salvia miltiorrhiza]|uniref:uncharacterized protein LOC131011251 n=1 Tax=Salvia miltiorrhiza TaxID=226208 RepID=UPI0025ACB94A|nr:uncharacterized protein LOC131011251 [Salvia miltiorrhiza]
MLEDIREMVMLRIKDRKNLCDRWIGEWSPAAMKTYLEAKEWAVGCRVLWNGEFGYEVGEGKDKHTVFLDKKFCTCRRWELTGIPCCHAIAAMCFSEIDPMSMILNWYHKSMYQKAYEYTIKPVPGVKFFKKELHAPIEPPPWEKMTGRPRKNRIRAQNEPSSSTRLSRKGQIQRCSICKDTGHKKTFCPTTLSQVIGKSQSSTSTRPTKMPVRRKTVGIGCHVNLSTGLFT